MSSLRNAVKRITHKERSQPKARSHLGLLEKHKDYVVRSRDHHKKVDRMRDMQSKADGRNPDEFYFGMHKSRVNADTGKHAVTEAARREAMQDVLGGDAVRIMKDQDLSYVRMRIGKDAKQVDKLRDSLHLLHDDQQSVKNTHSVFVDTPERAAAFDAARHFDTVPELVGRVYNRPRIATLLEQAGRSGDVESDDDKPKVSVKQREKAAKTLKRTAKRAARARSAAYSELEARTKRKEALESAEAHLVTEKLVRSKGRKRKIKDAEDGRPAVYKWRRRRAK